MITLLEVTSAVALLPLLVVVAVAPLLWPPR